MRASYPIREPKAMTCDVGPDAVIRWLKHFTSGPDGAQGTVFYAVDESTGHDSVVLHCEGTSDVAMTVGEAKAFASWLYRHRVEGCGSLCLQLCCCIEDIQTWGRTMH